MHVFALVICFKGASAEIILFNGVRKEKEELSEWPGDKKKGLSIPPTFRPLSQ